VEGCGAHSKARAACAASRREARGRAACRTAVLIERAGGLRLAGLPARAPMETSNVQPMIEPDAEQMRRHVAHLFEGFLDGCHEGRIELA